MLCRKFQSLMTWIHWIQLKLSYDFWIGFFSRYFEPDLSSYTKICRVLKNVVSSSSVIRHQLNEYNNKIGLNIQKNKQT